MTLRFIETDLGTSIELNILEYDLERNSNCNYDGLVVHGGPDLTSPELVKLCTKSDTNQTVSSTGNHLVVRFYSDSSVTSKGFAATFKTKPSGCGGLLTTPRGTIVSPNYPNMYDNHDDCEWLVRVEENHVVELTFEDFDVEPHNNCRLDHLRVCRTRL